MGSRNDGLEEIRLVISGKVRNALVNLAENVYGEEPLNEEIIYPDSLPSPIDHLDFYTGFFENPDKGGIVAYLVLESQREGKWASARVDPKNEKILGLVSELVEERYLEEMHGEYSISRSYQDDLVNFAITQNPRKFRINLRRSDRTTYFPEI